MLYGVETKNIIEQDIPAQQQFYPEDFVVTNPFNQFISKTQVIERLRSNIIKYSKYEREFDAFRFYENTAVVIGTELVVPTHDANRPDAGQTVKRRFTEVWVKRNGKWQKVVRHANNVVPLPKP